MDASTLVRSAHADGLLSDEGLVALTHTVTLIITDGADCHSKRARAQDVAAVVRDLARSESHIVAGLGIDDGATDFARVFGEMGIDPRWQLTPGSSQSEIRRAFVLFSQSVAAQGGRGAVAASLGGFGR